MATGGDVAEEKLAAMATGGDAGCSLAADFMMAAKLRAIGEEVVEFVMLWRNDVMM